MTTKMQPSRGSLAIRALCPKPESRVAVRSPAMEFRRITSLPPYVFTIINNLKVEARPVALMWMQDEAGPDAKIICVPPREPRWKDVHDMKDLPEQLLEEIKHFFDVYKALEPGKSSSTAGFEGRKAAWREIELAKAQHLAHPHGPNPD